jgi:hypothetical protein
MVWYGLRQGQVSRCYDKHEGKAKCEEFLNLQFVGRATPSCSEPKLNNVIAYILTQLKWMSEMWCVVKQEVMWSEN